MDGKTCDKDTGAMKNDSSSGKKPLDLLKIQKSGRKEGKWKKRKQHKVEKFGPRGQEGTLNLPPPLPSPLAEQSYFNISEYCLYVLKLINTCSFPSLGIVEIQTLSSLFILLKTTFGLKILFAIDGERIYIQLTSTWKRRTLGLCGTFNGNIRDDFL